VYFFTTIGINSNLKDLIAGGKPLVILLAITGVMLNHTETFKLDDNYVESSIILNWYGLEPEGEPVSFKVENHIISFWNKQVFFDKEIITKSDRMLRGAIKSERFIVAAFDHELLLLNDSGELIERMPTSASFSNIQRIGVKYARSVIETSEPLYYMADEHILDWDVIINEDIKWSEQTNLNTAQKEDLRQVFRGRGLTMERVILDLHSGRFFGAYGVYIMDAAAIALLWLSLSGLWVWWSRTQKQKRKHHYIKHHRH